MKSKTFDTKFGQITLSEQMLKFARRDNVPEQEAAEKLAKYYASKKSALQPVQ